jgi:23S rRNA (adenine2503-C2)-methyltransferase
MFEILETIKTPTGHIVIAETEDGRLEFLSLADYGQAKNIKADFLGLTKEINGVPHGEMLPLTEKWVITISTQYGCSMKCSFCDVPKVGPGKNISYDDMKKEIQHAVALHPEIWSDVKRLNIHFARMGEPTFNRDVIRLAHYFAWFSGRHDDWSENFDCNNVHPVVSTMMPQKNKDLVNFLESWMSIKNVDYRGNAGLQLSINSTDEDARREMFGGCALELEKISDIMGYLLDENGLHGRKITLNFALTDREINASRLKKLFDPKFFICKITPMHMTRACEENVLSTPGGYDFYYPYKIVEEELKNEGFDVIVFIPSKEEDESRITCGNAILSGYESVGKCHEIARKSGWFVLGDYCLAPGHSEEEIKLTP